MRVTLFLLIVMPLQAAVSLQTMVPQWVQDDGKHTAVYGFAETDISLYGAWEPDAAAEAVRLSWQKNGGEAKLKGAGTLDLKGGTLVAEGAAMFSVAAGVSITNAAVTLSGGATFAPASALEPTALSWSGSGNTWSGDLNLAATCMVLPDADAPLTVSGTLTLNGSLTAEGDWETLFLCHAIAGDVATWSNGRYEAVTQEGGLIALQRIQQQGGEQGGSSDSGEQGSEQGSGSDSGEQGGEQGSGSGSGEQGGEQGSGSDSGEQGGEQGNGSDSGEQGSEQGSGSDSGEQGSEQGSGSDSGEQGGEQGSGSDSGEQGGNNSPAPQGTLLTTSSGAFGEEDLRVEGNTALASDLSWAAHDAHELRGEGVLDLGGGVFRCAGGSFTVADGVSFTNGTAEVAEGAALQASGASLAGVSLRWNGGTIVTDAYALTAGRAAVSCSQGSGGISNTLAGDLTLAGGTLMLQGAATQQHPYQGALLTVTGSVTLQNATEIIFTLPNAEHSTEVQHIYPAAGTAVLTCGQWSGDVSLLSAAALWQGSVVPITTLSFETQTLATGETALLLKTAPSGTGHTLSDENRVSVQQGERVNLENVQDGLSNRFISGTGGAILTTPLQTLRLNGTDVLRYSVEAAEGNTHAANLRIGYAGGQTEDTDITLRGARYDAALTELLSGTLSISRGTVLGHDAESRLHQYGGVLRNGGSIRGSAVLHPHNRFINKGTVEGDVTMEAFSALRNEGRLCGLLTIGADALAQGNGYYHATRVCGGGTLNIDRGQRQEQLTLEEGARLLFPHIGQQSAPLSAGTLRTEGTATAFVTITPQQLSASLRPVCYPLVQAERAEGNAVPFRVAAQDATNGLLGSVRGHWDGHTLSVRLRVRNSPATAALTSAAEGVASTRYACADLLRTAAHEARHAPLLHARQTALHGGTFGGKKRWGVGLSARHSYSGVQAGMERGVTDALTAGLHLAAAHSDFRTASLRSRGNGAFLTATARTQKPISKHWSVLGDAYLAGGQMRHRAAITPQARLSASGRGHESTGAFGGGAELALQRRSKRGLAVTPFAGLHAATARSGHFTEQKEDGAAWQYSAATLHDLRAEAGVRLQQECRLGAAFTLIPALEISRSATLNRRNGTTTSTAYGYRGSSCGTAPSAQTWRAEATFTLRADAGYSLQLRGGAESDHEHRDYYAGAYVRVEF